MRRSKALSGRPESIGPSPRSGEELAIRTCFLQLCPSCRRPLRMPISLLGEQTACWSCGSEFTACATEGNGRSSCWRESADGR